MGKNTEIYDGLNSEEGIFEPSYMGIIPGDDSLKLSVEYLNTVLKNNPDFRKIVISEQDFGAYELKIEYQEEMYTALVSEQPNNIELLTNLSFLNRTKEEDQQKALSSKSYIDISIAFGTNPIKSYFFQLKLMDTIVPYACIGIDFSAMTVFSPDWLKMLITANVPPSPKCLYSIHAVYDEVGGEKVYWFHTHGLLRCGSIELEVVNLKHGAESIHNLLTTAGTLFIENHYKENQKFRVGYDGLDINLAWLRWEDALKQFPSNILGGLDERQDEEDVHTGPSGVLFAVEDNNLVSPEIYGDTLADNPILFISTEETLRMRSLALSQMRVFSQAFQMFGVKQNNPEKKSFLSKIFGGGKKEQELPQWSFLVKLGLVVDDAEEETEKEHLWFEVISIDEVNVTAKLLNEPYWIAKLKKDDIKTYPLEETLTDWITYAPDDSYSPDLAYLLDYRLEESVKR